MDHLDPARRSIPASIVALILVPLVLLVACTGDGAGADSADGLAVVDASIDRPANPRLAAVRLTVVNRTGEPDALVAVSTADGEASLHRSDTDAQGRSTMTELGRVDLPARSSVEFEPGGLHVMVTGITRDLEVGDTVTLTFRFERSEPLTLEVPVVDPLGLDDEHDHGALAPPATSPIPGEVR